VNEDEVRKAVYSFKSNVAAYEEITGRILKLAFTCNLISFNTHNQSLTESW